MAHSMIDNRDQFYAFLAAQPFCMWVAEKKKEIANGVHSHRGKAGINKPSHATNDNAELANALSSMA